MGGRIKKRDRTAALPAESVEPAEGGSADAQQPRKVSAEAQIEAADGNVGGKDDEAPALPKMQHFSDVNLDKRVLRAVQSALGANVRPTPIQCAVIPAALAGQDILAAAPTGSGKTLAYMVPIVDAILRRDIASSPAERRLRAVVLVPTRELVHQVASVARSLLRYAPQVRVRTLTGHTHARGDDSAPADDDADALQSDICVGTPSALAILASVAGADAFAEVAMLVIDEADLVLTYGYDAETKEALTVIPLSAQAMLVSATLTDDLEGLKKLVLRRAMITKITAGEGDDALGIDITHNYTELSQTTDKYLATYSLLRLGVLKGKTLVFVSSIESAFRLKLFLDKLVIRTAVLNAELPINSRIHCVEQFNAGIFDVLIACDIERSAAADRQKKPRSSSSVFKPLKSAPFLADTEFGLSRGVDFHNVATVLNFDAPRSARSYTHRAGRTARAGRHGAVLTLLAGGGERERLDSQAAQLGMSVQQLHFKLDQVERFRYRVEDCLRGITSAAINDARVRDVKREMLTSERLQAYFEEHPYDLQALQHDRTLATRINSHLGDIPDYLLPQALQQQAMQARLRSNALRGRKGRGRGAGREWGRMHRRRDLKRRAEADPLENTDPARKRAHTVGRGRDVKRGGRRNVKRAR